MIQLGLCSTCRVSLSQKVVNQKDAIIIWVSCIRIQGLKHLLIGESVHSIINRKGITIHRIPKIRIVQVPGLSLKDGIIRQILMQTYGYMIIGLTIFGPPFALVYSTT